MLENDLTIDVPVRGPRITAVELALDLFPVAMAGIMLLVLLVRVTD
jgi:hypothetical protein